MIKSIKYHQGLLVGKRRKNDANRTLGRYLAFIAGAINAGGFMVVGQYTSHMTGVTSIIADRLALGQWTAAITMIFYMACFIAGAATTTIIVLWAKSYNLHSRYALPIAMEAMLLVIFAIINSQYTPALHTGTPYIIALLCYLMGLQNAVITKISGTRIRTTHVTGMVTDIGIGAGKMLFPVFRKQYVNQDREQVMLHISIVAMFLSGGVCGAYGFSHIGFLTVLPLAGFLFLIAYTPIVKDINTRKYLRERLCR